MITGEDGQFRRIMALVLNTIEEILWPGRCLYCETWIPESQKGLCSKCWQELMRCMHSDACPSCGSETSAYGVLKTRCAKCQEIDYAFDGICRVGVYETVLRKMILDLKFHDKTETAVFLSRNLESAYLNTPFRDEIDCFVPVPLHWKRQISRGCNQSLLLCRQLKRYRPVSTDLVRIRYTPSQRDMTWAGRLRNVRGAFGVRRGHPFSDRTACLVDDITTSRATLNECARTLKAVGARKVYAIVVAAAKPAHFS